MSPRTVALLAFVLLAKAADPVESAWKAGFLASRPPKAPSTGAALVGVTVWRLQSVPHEEDPHVPLVQDRSGVIGPAVKAGGWTPRRFAVGAAMPVGQKFMLAIESTRAGYLYVFGAAETAERIEPGRIMLVPPSHQQPPYLTRAKSGELFYVLFSPDPLPNRTPVEEWGAKWGAPAVGRTIRSSKGAPVSAAELLAAGQAWTLSPDDPPPMTIYHCSGCPSSDSPVWFQIEPGIER